MRIAVVARSADRVGGAEAYVQTLLPLLVERGHEAALCLELPGTGKGEPEGTERFDLSPEGAPSRFPRLRRWRPDVVFVNGLLSSHSEEALLDIAPNVLLAHNYRGTCISGTKTRSWPRASPCGRTLGWGCLAHYFPRRCGGRSPVTMARDFARERRRQRLLGRYARVLTLSDHMRREYVGNGASESRAFVLPWFAPHVDAAQVRRESPGPWRLLYLGRMEFLKGGDLLVDALPHVRAELDTALDVTFAGEGRRRQPWESMAAALRRRYPDVFIRFTGWLAPDAVRATLSRTDLLIMPSRWPEPFGLAGTEAAAHGVPSAAFAAGGIPEWLEDGVTGHLAPAGPPSADRLASAIVQCLRDREHHAALGAAARRRAREHGLEPHVQALEEHLKAAASSPRSAEEVVP